LMGMLVIFTSVASIFIDSGMGSGLIQKSNKTDKDYSTVFLFNLLVAAGMYLLLFFLAPFVAEFYKEERLTFLLRIISLNLLIGSFVSIQRLKLNIDLNFKALAKVNLASNILSGIIAIIFANHGLGYWALAVQLLLASIFNLIFLLILANWKYSFLFSKESFQELFSFGSKLLFAHIYAQTFRNVYNVFIGKYYSSDNLGYYTRAVGLTELVSGTVTSVIEQVTYPLFSSLKNEQDRMISVFRRVIRMASFINFPSIVLLSVLAEPIVLILLTDKWAEVVPLLQWMAFGRILYPMSALNLNLLNANGRSDLFLKVDLSKMPIMIVAMLVTISFGIKAMIIGQVITSFLAYFLNAFMPGKLFGFGALKQLNEIKYIVLNSLIMGMVVVLSISLLDSLWLKLISGLFLGVFTYFLLSYKQKSSELYEFLSILKRL
ncbi:MAG: lipopolysaccharide biosynthesis protein, partial [Candidatus Staskawiczbacteria bacterium]|nr:lipopolysaccharide biosynthesis protein [Candidatus Staskawiczbacteria bacterium]